MRIDFKKFSKEPKNFRYESLGACLEGSIWHKCNQLYELNASLRGEILLTCDRTGEEYTKKLDEQLCFFLSDGLFESSADEGLEVIEFFEGFVDIASLLEDELESIRLEYHTLEDVD